MKLMLLPKLVVPNSYLELRKKGERVRLSTTSSASPLVALEMNESDELTETLIGRCLYAILEIGNWR